MVIVHENAIWILDTLDALQILKEKEENKKHSFYEIDLKYELLQSQSKNISEYVEHLKKVECILERVFIVKGELHVLIRKDPKRKGWFKKLMGSE